MMRSFWLVVALAALTGCGQAISPAVAPGAAAGVDFEALAADPTTFEGQTVILGGEIVSLGREGEGTLITITQMPLDAHQYPVEGGVSGGTFVVESAAWLDKTAYVPQRKITVAGEVAGRRQGMLWLRSRQLHLWQHPDKLVPIPPSWYGYDPAWEYWYKPPYYDPYRQAPVR